MYILIMHGACDAGWVFPTAKDLWENHSVHTRLDAGDPETLEEFTERLDSGEHLDISLVLTVHKCVNCTPDGSCAPLSAVREQAKIEAEARAANALRYAQWLAERK